MTVNQLARSRPPRYRRSLKHSPNSQEVLRAGARGALRKVAKMKAAKKFKRSRMRGLFLMVLLSAGCAHARNLDVRGTNGTRTFTVAEGTPRDFVGVSRVCVTGFDLDSTVDVRMTIMAVLRKRAPYLTFDCGGTSSGRLEVQYSAGYSFVTHSPPPSLGPRAGFGFVSVRPPGRGVMESRAEWTDNYGGTAEEVATHFANDLVTFLTDPSKPFTSRQGGQPPPTDNRLAAMRAPANLFA
jgi:hypothetical protein